MRLARIPSLFKSEKYLPNMNTVALFPTLKLFLFYCRLAYAYAFPLYACAHCVKREKLYAQEALLLQVLVQCCEFWWLCAARGSGSTHRTSFSRTPGSARQRVTPRRIRHIQTVKMREKKSGAKWRKKKDKQAHPHRQVVWMVSKSHSVRKIHRHLG